jgi:hypothetical protein
MKFDGVKVFSATMQVGRDALGEVVTEWLASRPECRPTEFLVLQSSDSRFHCVSVVVFYTRG